MKSIREHFGFTLANLGKKNHNIIAISCDLQSACKLNLFAKKFPKRFKFINDKFSSLDQIKDLKIRPKAIIFDLGLSSLQFLRTILFTNTNLRFV